MALSRFIMLSAWCFRFKGSRLNFMFDRIVLASGNQGKLTELQALFGSLNCQLVSQKSLGVTEPDEPYFSFLENALHKARHASAVSGLPALADDSGICVNALGGEPGVLSARFSGLNASATVSKQDVDYANNATLIKALQDQVDRSAFYYCVLVLVRSAQDPAPFVADGYWSGTVLDEARGAGGFGYDPFFFLPSMGKSVAQLSIEEKNVLSHRAIASRLLLEKLRALA
jgi:XTP/dITP diphosphohydrolase